MVLMSVLVKMMVKVMVKVMVMVMVMVSFLGPESREVKMRGLSWQGKVGFHLRRILLTYRR